MFYLRLSIFLLCCPSGNPPVLFHLNEDFFISKVLRESQLWATFEENGERPFPGAVILGDNGYPCNQWLITPIPGEEVGVKEKFNKSHRRTRNCIERCFGSVKKRFYALATGLRVRNMEQAAKLVECCFILHNMCLESGDNGEDFLEGDGPDPDLAPEAAPPEAAPQMQQVQKRREQLMRSFS